MNSALLDARRNGPRRPGRMRPLSRSGRRDPGAHGPDPGTHTDNLRLARSLSVGPRAPRRGARGRALPRPHRCAGPRKPDRRPRRRGFRVQHQWLGRVCSDGGRRPPAWLHDPPQAPIRPAARSATPWAFSRAPWIDRLCRHGPAMRAEARWRRSFRRRPAAWVRSPAGNSRD